MISNNIFITESGLSFRNFPQSWSALLQVLSPNWVRHFSEAVFPGYSINYAEVVERVKAAATAPKPTQVIRTFTTSIDQPTACVCYTILCNFYFRGRWISQRKGYNNKECPTGSLSSGVCVTSEGYQTVSRFALSQSYIDPMDNPMAVAMQLNGLPVIHTPYDPKLATLALEWCVNQGLLPCLIFSCCIDAIDFKYIDRTYPPDLVMALKRPPINPNDFHNFVPVPHHSLLEQALYTLEVQGVDLNRLTPSDIQQAALPYLNNPSARTYLPSVDNSRGMTFTRGEWVLRMEGEYPISKPFRDDPTGRWYMILAVLVTLFFTVVSGYPTYILNNGTNISDPSSLMDSLMTEQPFGIYKVCFGSKCLRRVSNGTEHFCGSISCNNWPIYPFRCPSMDWQPECLDTSEECASDCSACGGVFDEKNVCWYKYDTAGADVATYNSLPGSRLAVGDTVYFQEYGPVTDADTRDDNLTKVESSQLVKFTHDPLPWLIASAVVSLLSLLLLIVERVMACAAYYKKENTAKEEAAELVNETEDESVPKIESQQWRFRFLDIAAFANNKLIFLSLVLSVVGIIMVNADENVETWEEYQRIYNGAQWTVPSSCSCSNPNEITSQLTCKTGCQDTITVANMTLRMNFGLKVTCVRKKMYVLDELQEGTCMWCNCATNCESKKHCMPYMTQNHSQSWWHESVNTPPSRTTCGVYCVSNGNLGHWMNWRGSIYDADVCTISEPTSPGIWGLPDQTAYVYNIKSNLESQTTFIRVYGTYEGLYKEINGGLGSDRAWIVEPTALNGNHLKEGTTAYSNIISRRILSTSKEDCYKLVTHELNQFKPTPFNEKCEVTVTFSSMRCFQLNEVHSGKCRHINGHYQFIANHSGMVDGRYVSANFWQDLPESWTCDNECNAYRSSAERSAECAVDMWDYIAPHINGSNSSAVTWAFVAKQKAFNILSIIFVAVAISALAILCIGLVSCICKRA